MQNETKNLHDEQIETIHEIWEDSPIGMQHGPLTDHQAAVLCEMALIYGKSLRRLIEALSFFAQSASNLFEKIKNIHQAYEDCKDHFTEEYLFYQRELVKYKNRLKETRDMLEEKCQEIEEIEDEEND